MDLVATYRSNGFFRHAIMTSRIGNLTIGELSRRTRDGAIIFADLIDKLDVRGFHRCVRCTPSPSAHCIGSIIDYAAPRRLYSASNFSLVVMFG
jgi:hypothetical protein